MPETKNTNDLAGARDTLESIWVAIVLALVLRAFVLEAFVIPTGSMAPHLMGQHLELTCSECGYSWPFGVHFDRHGRRAQPEVIRCPMCDSRVAGGDFPVLSGDRVLVLKYLYQFRNPSRFDVVVFRNPQSNLENYIKRLAGLPGEALRIIHGDVYVHRIADADGDGVRDEADLDRNGDGAFTRADYSRLDWTIARKRHDVQEGIWRLIHDSDYVDLADEAAWPRFWRSAGGAADGAWRPIVHGRAFEYAGGAGEPLWFARETLEPFYADVAYNSQAGDSIFNSRTDISYDLKLETTVAADDPAASLRLCVSNFEHDFAAEFDFAGRARLLHRLLDPATGAAAGPWETMIDWVDAPAVRPGEAPQLAVAHADWRVSVLVNGEAICATEPEQYRPNVELLLETMSAVNSGRGRLPAPQVRIEPGPAAMTLYHNRLWQDVFYTTTDLGFEETRMLDDRYAQGRIDAWRAERGLGPQDWSSGGPAGVPCWGAPDNPIVLRDFGPGLDPRDEFFMLGDNSPQSKDSRMWVTAAPTLRLRDDGGEPLYRLGTVPRYNLIGKAFFVYWPGGRPLLGVDRLPIVPSVGQMRVIE